MCSSSQLQHCLFFRIGASCTQVAASGLLSMLGDTAAIKASQCLEDFVRMHERLRSSADASTSGVGVTLQPPPRRCMPMGLLAAGGHDAGWRSFR